MEVTTLLIIIVIVCGLYMSWNIGANDVANALGTSVGSGALTLRRAVIIASVLEFSGAFFFGDHVSKTVEEGILNASLFSSEPMLLGYGFLASLIGAGVWLQIASYYGWPVSTTHSIIGALVGFGVTVGGFESVYWGNILQIGLGWIFFPLLGGFLAYILFHYILRKIIYVAKPFRAAKRIIPVLVGLLGIIFAVVFAYDEMLQHGLDQNISLGLCLAFGVLASLVSVIYLRNARPPKPMELSPSQTYDPKVLEELEQARRYLKKVRKMATGDLEFQTAQLVHEVSELKCSIHAQEETQKAQHEYDAVERLFGRMQWMSACLMAFAHGANDVANAIGPLVAAVSLFATGEVVRDGTVPLWALLLGGGGIVFGLITWGWRVIETIGKKLTELTPTRGFTAEFAAASTILIASRLGFPVSATHTLVGAVIGVGMARGIEALNLATMRNIVISWVVTIPAGALVAVISFHIIKFIFG